MTAPTEWCDACKAAEVELVSGSAGRDHGVWPRESYACSRIPHCRTQIMDTAAEAIAEWERLTGRKWREGAG